MHASIEKIKQGILHPDEDVRRAAAFYFSRSHATDPEVMPLAIQAIGQYGPDAFQAYGFMQDLVQTDETVSWLLREIERIAADENEELVPYYPELLKTLRRADPACLKRHETAIQSLYALHPLDKAFLSDRIRVSALPPESLWQELLEACRRMDVEMEEYPPEGYDHACSIVQALARHPESCTPRVLAILADEDEFVDAESVNWFETMAVRLAGELKLEAALPDLVERIQYPDSMDADEATYALALLGSDAAVSELVTAYIDAEWEYRSAIIDVLGTLPTEASQRACLDLLDGEDEVDIRGFLLEAALGNFSLAAIEPARQHILGNPKDPELLSVRTALLVACKLLETSVPEFGGWLDDSRHDAEFRRQWQGDDWDVEDEDFHEEDLDEEEEEYQGEPITIVRRSEKIGRNDPCPCGSGKKFKKCCYGKEQALSELEQAPPSAMSSLDQPQFPLGTVTWYGPDDKTTTKIVAGVFKRDGDEPILMRWVGSNIGNSPKVQREMRTFFEKHKVKSVATSPGNMSCPHEEGPDFPIGEDCPFCPFWAGKQGSNFRE